MTKEEKFFLHMKDEISKLENRHQESTNLSSHLKVKQEEMRKLETIEERKEKASLASLQTHKKLDRDNYQTTNKSSMPSIITMPEY